jgi:N,N-dimethylformamidase beta subunit-like, C-terminal
MPSWAYAWPPSVADGDTFTIHVSATGPVDIEVARVGGARTVVWQAARLDCEEHAFDGDTIARGCDWPVTATVTVEGWPSGYYEIVATVVGEASDPAATSAFVVVRPATATANRLLLALSTNTWYAYNDVGGGNCYSGEPLVSARRPLARGFLDRPAGPGDRLAAPTRDGADPTLRAYRHHVRDHALSLVCGCAGWWNQERVFVGWAENEGWGVDVVTNLDLERHPDVVDRYPLLCSVGHDEYWTAGMRDTVEAYIAGGGNVAFLSGNTCYWQVRFESDRGDADAVMVAYKQRIERDPVYGTEREAELTSIWSDRAIGRPENVLTGVSFVRGGYARIGRRSPNGAGGYTVHRPDHWLFDGTGVAYGDVLGAAGTVVGYECDGCDFATVDGLPVPTGSDGTPASFVIAASAPAQGFDRESALLPVPAGDRSEIEFNALRVFGDAEPATVERVAHGRAVLGSYRSRAGGTVVTTGCTDWAYGLREHDPQVEQVTRNILNRLAGP